MGGCKCKGRVENQTNWELGYHRIVHSHDAMNTQPLPWIGWIVGTHDRPIEGVRSQTVCCFVGFALQNLWWRTLQFVRCNAADPVTNTLFCCSCVVHFTTFQLVAGGTWQIRNPFFWGGTMATILQANSQLIDWVVDLGFCSPCQFFIFFCCSHAYHLLAEDTLQMMSKTWALCQRFVFSAIPKAHPRYTDWFWRFQLLWSLKADFWGKHTWSHDWPHKFGQSRSQDWWNSMPPPCQEMLPLVPMSENWHFFAKYLLYTLENKVW